VVKTKQQVKIGVIGAGHLGKIHLKLLKEIAGYDIVGFCDVDNANAEKVAHDMGITRYLSMTELIDNCDAIDVVTPTTTHYEIAALAAKKFKHVFIEKPLTHTLPEAARLVKLVDEAGVKCMIGHVERFNPALLSIDRTMVKPLFIEVHRLAQFNPRGTDVSVVHDLMIHDIDIILSLVKANVKRVSASGVAIVSQSPDIANARIEFDNGCVANVTASRISVKNMRKMRIFQQGAYISLDFLEQTSEVFRISDVAQSTDPPPFEIELADTTKKYITYEQPEKKPVNAIKMELELFLHSIQHDTPTPVGIHDGYHAMELGQRILDKINQQLNQQ
jgi:predicted dehydrogenase